MGRDVGVLHRALPSVRFLYALRTCPAVDGPRSYKTPENTTSGTVICENCRENVQRPFLKPMRQHSSVDIALVSLLVFACERLARQVDHSGCICFGNSTVRVPMSGFHRNFCGIRGVGVRNGLPLVLLDRCWSVCVLWPR